MPEFGPDHSPNASLAPRLRARPRHAGTMEPAKPDQPSSPTPAATKTSKDHLGVNVALANQVASLQMRCGELREELDALKASFDARVSTAVVEATRPTPNMTTKVQVELAAGNAERKAAAAREVDDEWTAAGWLVELGLPQLLADALLQRATGRPGQRSLRPKRAGGAWEQAFISGLGALPEHVIVELLRESGVLDAVARLVHIRAASLAAERGAADERSSDQDAPVPRTTGLTARCGVLAAEADEQAQSVHDDVPEVVDVETQTDPMPMPPPVVQLSAPGLPPAVPRVPKKAGPKERELRRALGMVDSMIDQRDPLVRRLVREAYF